MSGSYAIEYSHAVASVQLVTPQECVGSRFIVYTEAIANQKCQWDAMPVKLTSKAAAADNTCVT